MATNRGLTLQPYVQERYVAGGTEVFRWRLEVTEARGLPAAVFLYKQVPTKLFAAESGGAEPPVAVELAGDFNGVAGVTDLEYYPEDAPDPDKFPPFYRLSWVDQTFDSRHVAAAAFDAIVAQVRTLVENLDIAERLAATAPIAIGDPPPP